MVIRVPIKKSKAIKKFILFIALLLLFTIMAVQPELFVKSGGSGFVKITGFMGSFVLIIATAFVAQKVFNKKPGLIIDNEGIIDNSLGVMFPKLNWSAVTEIKHLKSNEDNFIKLSIIHPEKYIARETNPLKRKMLEMNYKTLQTPVNIAASRLRIDFQELWILVENKYQSSK